MEIELNRLVNERRLPDTGSHSINPDGSNFWFEESELPCIRGTDVNDLPVGDVADLVDIGRLVIAPNKGQPPPPPPPLSHQVAISCSTKDQTPPPSSSTSASSNGQSGSLMNNQHLAQLAKIIQNGPSSGQDYAKIELLFDFHCHLDTDRMTPMPECLVVGPSGQILVTDGANRKIKMYRSDGNFQLEIQCRSQPYGIAVLGNDKFAVTLYDEVSQKATVEFYEMATGNYLRALAYTSECKNRRMAIGSTTQASTNGTTNTGFVLTDSDCNQLRLYDPSGQLLSSFDLHAVAGSSSHRLNQTNKSANACYAHHVVYVDAPTGSKRATGDTISAPMPTEPMLIASVLDSNHICAVGALSGKLMFRYGSQGIGKEQLSSPCGLAVDPKGNLVVADCANSRLHILSQQGNLICHLPASGSKSSKGIQQSLRQPKAVAFTSGANQQHRLVVAERSGHIKVFSYATNIQQQQQRR